MLKAIIFKIFHLYGFLVTFENQTMHNEDYFL